MAANMILLIVASTLVLSTNAIRSLDSMKVQSDEHMKFIRHPALPPFFGGHGLGRPAFGVGPVIGFGPFGGIVGGGGPNGGGLGFGIGIGTGTGTGTGAGSGLGFGAGTGTETRSGLGFGAGSGTGTGTGTETGTGTGLGFGAGSESGSGSGFGSTIGGGGFGSGNVGGGFGFNGDSNEGTSPIDDGSFTGGQVKAALENQKP